MWSEEYGAECAKSPVRWASYRRANAAARRTALPASSDPLKQTRMFLMDMVVSLRFSMTGKWHARNGATLIEIKF